MTVRKGLGQANILRTNNNTSTGYGIAYADEVSGHRTVANLTALYALNDWQLSASGDNTNNDAIGQLWYVVDADGNGNGCYYQLKDWNKRNDVAGWSIADYTTKAELQDKIDIIATADEEDITTEGDTPQTQVLKLKDRAYDSLNASGKGYKILRKNWQLINGVRKNVLTQEMINESNTVYEIRYDFDLDNQEMVIYDNCVLRFNGGSLKNGTIRGSSSSIIDSNSCCLYNVKILGFNKIYLAKWFGNNLANILPYVHNCELHLEGITYNLTTDVNIEIGTKLIGHNTVINSNSHIYMGWRTSVRNIKFISTNPLIECLSIIGSKIYESRQRYTDYEDTQFLIIGIKISYCHFNSKSKIIYFEPSKVEESKDINFFDGSGFSFYINNNQFNSSGDDNIYINNEQGWMTAFDITKNVTNTDFPFLHVSTLSSSVTGINIIDNDIQLNNKNTCAIILEAASSVNIINNRIWDFYNEVIHISKNNCIGINIQFPFKGDSTYTYIKYIDKDFTGKIVPSLVKVTSFETDYVGYFPSPTHSDSDGTLYYKLWDFMQLPLGNYTVDGKNVKYLIGEYSNLPQQSQIGWVLNISRPIYRQVIITLYPTSNVMGYGKSNVFDSIIFRTYCNTDKNNYIDINKKVSKEIWSVILSPFVSKTPQYTIPGMVYFDTDKRTLAFIDDKNNKKAYDGRDLDVNKFGETTNRPITGIYEGFQFYDTTINKLIWWNGQMWIDANGIKAELNRKGDSNSRPALMTNEAGFQYYDTDLKKYIVWNGTEWTNMDGSSL